MSSVQILNSLIKGLNTKGFLCLSDWDTGTRRWQGSLALREKEGMFSQFYINPGKSWPTYTPKKKKILPDTNITNCLTSLDSLIYHWLINVLALICSLNHNVTRGSTLHRKLHFFPITGNLPSYSIVSTWKKKQWITGLFEATCQTEATSQSWTVFTHVY